MRLLHSIKNNEPGPDELGEFRVQEAFWTRFGATIDDLENWPEAKVQVYLKIMELEAKVAKEQNEQQNGPSAAQGTEMAYRKMTEGRG